MGRPGSGPGRPATGARDEESCLVTTPGERARPPGGAGEAVDRLSSGAGWCGTVPLCGRIGCPVFVLPVTMWDGSRPASGAATSRAHRRPHGLAGAATAIGDAPVVGEGGDEEEPASGLGLGVGIRGCADGGPAVRAGVGDLHAQPPAVRLGGQPHVEVPAGHASVLYGVCAQLGGDQRQCLVDVAGVGGPQESRQCATNSRARRAPRGVEVKTIANSVEGMGRRESSRGR